MRLSMNLMKVNYLLVTFLFTTTPVVAKIYKCPSKDGGITFSQTPCPNGFEKEKGQWVSLEKKRKIKKDKEIAEKKRIAKETARIATEERKEEELAKEKEKIKKERRVREIIIYAKVKENYVVAVREQ